MKKLFKCSMLLLTALLMLSLAACGGQAPAPEPAEQPDSAETTEPAAESNALPAPNYLTFAPGDTAEQDIDGDGQAEEVRVWLEDGDEDFEKVVCLSVNGEDLSKALSEAGGIFFCPDEQCWLLTDLDTEDGHLEIAIQDWGPSDDLTTSFYRYDAGTLTPIGLVEGFVFRDGAPADVSFDGQGTVHSYMRFDVLQTWWGKTDSVLGEDGMLVILPQDYYESTAETPQQVTALCDLCAYDAPNGQQDLLAAGTELELLGTDNVEWVKARAAGDGQELWLHLNPDSPFQVEGPDGFVDGWDALDNLCMAD